MPKKPFRWSRAKAKPATASIPRSEDRPRIYGGQWNTVTAGQVVQHNIYGSSQGGLQTLQKEVASNAFHNSAERQDAPKCHPGTRKKVTEAIMKWIQDGNDRAECILWLSGPAGAGKSAIVQTIAEQCAAVGLPAASFFFFRADATRNRVHPLVATLAYQVMAVYPETKATIIAAVDDNPLIFSQSLEDQFWQLIAHPLWVLQQSTSKSPTPVAFLIDGLDECDCETKGEQETLIRTIHTFVMKGDSPFIFLVASRPEARIAMAFNHLGNHARKIFLNDDFDPSQDIRHFVNEEFTRIYATHHLAHTLAPDWPPKSVVDDVVEKSSGQFIYAATVMRFVAYSACSPEHSIQIIRGLLPVTKHSPFSQIDSVYSHILSNTANIDAVKDILAAQLLRNRHPGFLRLSVVVSSLSLSMDHVESHLSDLPAIVRYNREEEAVTFYHASFEDYLLDSSRSGTYCVYLDSFVQKLAVLSIREPLLPDFAARLHIINAFLKLVKSPTAELTEALSPNSKAFLFIDTTTDKPTPSVITEPVMLLLSSLSRIYYKNDEEAYMFLLRQWLSWIQTSLAVPSANRNFFHGYKIAKVEEIWHDIQGGTRKRSRSWFVRWARTIVS